MDVTKDVAKDVAKEVPKEVPKDIAKGSAAREPATKGSATKDPAATDSAAGSAGGPRSGSRRPAGEAEVVLDRPQRPIGVLVLGHGASGGVDTPDLVAVRDAAVAAGFIVARVTQPYRLAAREAPAASERGRPGPAGAGVSSRAVRRPPPPAPHLDAAFIAVVDEIRRRVGTRLPVVVGGRSMGARVAARTAGAVGATAVLALAFPLHPPGRPQVTRAAELDPARPTLVINGDADPFGVPEPAGAVEVAVRPGERHDLRRDPAGVAAIAVAWLRARIAGAR